MNASKRKTFISRVLLVSFVAACACMWIYAFFLAPSGNPDRMEDRAWPEAAANRCDAALSKISLLPTASQAKSPAERADSLDQTTEVVRSMVNDLAQIEGGTSEDRNLINHWLSDWEVYITDRHTHAQRLRNEGDIKPLLTALASGAGSVLERMNGFARVNDMESCLDPGDM